MKGGEELNGYASKLLRGDDRWADTSLKERERAFSAKINPKPSEAERAKMKEEYLAKQVGVIR